MRLVYYLYSEFNSGFTLVEILVAISILAVIGVISIPNLSRFNDNQTLQVVSSDLVRVLRQAQSSANSRIGCVGNFISREWDVTLTTNTYSLYNSCYVPTNGSALPPTLFYTSPSSIPSTISIVPETLSGTCGGATIHFMSEYQPYDQNRFRNVNFGCGLPAENNLRITISYLGQRTYVCMNKGGSIYAAGTACPL